MLTTIPFSGFYNSLHDGDLDQALEQMFSDRATGCRRNEKLEQWVFGKCNWGLVHANYAKAYAEAYAEEFDVPSLKFESLRSPKEYNFETDRIFCTVDLEDVKKLKARVGPVDLAVAAEARFTDRSGFISFYPPNVDDWGPVETWDANQIGTLMIALSAGYFEINPETYLMERANTNGALEQWIAGATPGIDRAYRIHDYLQNRAERKL